MRKLSKNCCMQWLNRHGGGENAEPVTPKTNREEGIVHIVLPQGMQFLHFVLLHQFHDFVHHNALACCKRVATVLSVDGAFAAQPNGLAAVGC